MLVDNYDAVLYDLDGVIYRGPTAIDGAVATVNALRERGVAQAFITNNASRAPETVAEHLTRLGIHAGANDVVTSAQAIADVLAVALPTGARVFVVGSDALAAELTAVGLCPVREVDADPVALVQGYNPDWTVTDLQNACVLIQRGLPWYASNDDLTIPTDRGIMPGMGAWINLLSAACRGARPVATAGKPHRPLLEQTLERLRQHGGAQRPLVVGDRLDTDIAGANAIGIDSLFVLSGAHTRDDLAAAPSEQHPTWIGDDVRALLAFPQRPQRLGGAGADSRDPAKRATETP